jgi:serine protease AprX
MRPALPGATKEASAVKARTQSYGAIGGNAATLARVQAAAVLFAITLITLIMPSVARADALLSPGLAQKAGANPAQTFKVIVQGTDGKKSDAVADEVEATEVDNPGTAIGLRKKFITVSGVAADLTGKQILKLATKKGIGVITEDAPVKLAALTSKQRWPFAAGVAQFWAGIEKSSLQAPTIAVVDSGIEASRADFGGRVVKQVSFTSLLANSPGDGYGHGTFVAGIAAGSAQDYAGAAPNAKLVSLDVVDDKGSALTSDVISAADWILRNKDTYGIRVANFSLHNSVYSSFRFDPLDKAVEKLWFSGVVVVAAAGNYHLAESGVPYSPGNDPFVITVGADDIDSSVAAKDDFAAPWSSFGYTLDGFAKPELGAPGRYMVAAVPTTSTLYGQRPDRIVAPGYMQISGTSFSAPVIAGAAAYILAVHPEWTPDQVKGALMLTARDTPSALPLSTGVGEAYAPSAIKVLAPPNPNLALNRFLVADPAGGSTPVFDDASWSAAAQGDASWSAASWSAASWSAASWSAASWSAASWSAASWSAASWSAASWSAASWSASSSSDISWLSAAENEGLATGGDWITLQELLLAKTDLGLTP